jgi:hypothetical protein
MQLPPATRVRLTGCCRLLRADWRRKFAVATPHGERGGILRKILRMAIAAAFGLLMIVAVNAQKSVQTSPGTGGSPHYKSEWDVKGAHITIEYGRPYLKGRTIGKDVAPYGEPWRTGADEATIITSTKPLKFGKIALAAGTTYTINTLPSATGWQLIIGKLGAPGQWGIPYQPNLEIARTPMKVSKTSTSVEQVTISIDPTASGADLRVEWGTVSASAPFTID